MRVTVGMPTTGMVKTQTVAALIGAITHSRADAMAFSFQQFCYVHLARMRLVEAARKFQADYLIFVDADMTFEPEAFNKLLASGKEIVGAHYFMRRLPPLSVVKMADENGKLIEGEITIPKEIFKCYATGTGLMAVKMEVFEKIPRPWFFYQAGEMNIGEDVWFCERAREAGYDVWCDPTIAVGHIGDYVY
jgi:hypothetical protein